ncbi:MAG: cytidine deaminase [archaeon]
MRNIKFEELNKNQKELLQEASKVMETAYNPYSNFYVGAAIRAQDGTVISASNTENAAYGSTICAERNALGKANSMNKRMYDSIAIIARRKDFDTKEVTAPCGACRQMIFESSQISEKNIELILSTTKKDKIIVTSIDELLPLAFGPKDLGIDITKYQK